MAVLCGPNYCLHEMKDLVYVLDGGIYFFQRARLLSSLNGDLKDFLTQNECHMLLALVDGVIEKDVLIKQVWGTRGVVVTDSSYYKTLHTLRARLQALNINDGGIKTIPRVGAALSCSVAVVEQSNVILAVLEAGLRDDSDVDPAVVMASLDVAEAQACDAVSHIATLNKVAEDQIEMEAHRRKKRSRWISGLTLCAIVVAVSVFIIKRREEADLVPIEIPEFAGAHFYIEQGDAASPRVLGEKARACVSKPPLSGDTFYVERPRSCLLVSCQRSVHYRNPLCKNYLTIRR